ncbi:hypothetical protein AYO21_11174 [Fonsecaea monophora]|uniref:Homeobox domain-containing protein n=1 Tax=Fonsecaea monophora TaxID=254056 RepID=A0A177EUB9_9EURO|nr:hypothetical protein AYO21_11174 [Fonsecaea monophora]KAH0829888.1 hypothetical protein FOPE_10374 [Fonsecaea pedrosoi]OAG34662.1 hypothetical protein AYO21_11174 [Fonsecaea monophora]
MNTRVAHSSTGKLRPSPPHSSGNLSSHEVECEDVTALDPPASSALGVATPYTLNRQPPLTPPEPPAGGKRKLEPADEHGQAERSKKHLSAGKLAFLEARFAEDMFPRAKDREKMAKELGLDGSRVLSWFQNKRHKEKRKNPSGLRMPLTPQDDAATLMTGQDKSAAQSPTYIAPASVRRMACRLLRIGTWESADVIVARTPDTQTINYSIAGTESWLMIQYPMSAIRETRVFRHWTNGLPTGVGIYLNEAPKFFSSTLRFGVELTPRDDFTGGQASSNLLHILSDSGVATALTTSLPSLSPAMPILWPPNQTGIPVVTTRQPGQWFNGVNSTYNQAFGAPVYNNLRGQRVWAGEPGAATGSSLPTITPWYETQRPVDVPMHTNAQPMQMNAPMQYNNTWPVWPATTVNHYPASPLGPQEVAGGSSTTPMGSHTPYHATAEDAHRQTIEDLYNAAQPDMRAKKVGPTLEDVLEASNEVAEAPDDDDDPCFFPGLKFA